MCMCHHPYTHFDHKKNTFECISLPTLYIKLQPGRKKEIRWEEKNMIFKYKYFRNKIEVRSRH